MDLIYTKDYIENFKEDPEKYLSLGISFTCIYILMCLLFAYGAYTFKNILMIGYILLELLRLIFLVFVITTWLLVLKENTMDIGVLIGTSVAGSFFLLGMFYSWICTASLPVLINEMERDEQAATIYKLTQMLNNNHSTPTQGLQPVYGAPFDSDLSSYQKTDYNKHF
ncbi:uncharacterized protein [Epargyreus clarus]|uniref:uncharacterized protein n=1 Tax=Epargyreus clarus TaxID=520877 RepID=UPI003C2DA09F